MRRHLPEIHGSDGVVVYLDDSGLRRPVPGSLRALDHSTAGMAEPFLGELKLMSFNFPPKGWAFCNGGLLPINQNQGLFALLGTTYGGNGQTTFALPDLRGRTPFHRGNGMTQGERRGEATHTLSISEIPAHNHPVQASSATGTQAIPGLLASANNAWGAASDLIGLKAETLATYGGSQAHENRPPSLVLSWCIALQGIFPSQN